MWSLPGHDSIPRFVPRELTRGIAHWDNIYALCALKQPFRFTSTLNYKLRMERWFRPSSSLSLRRHLHTTHHSDLQPTELADGCSVQIRGTGAIGNPTKLARGVERWQLRNIGHYVRWSSWLAYRLLHCCPITLGIIHLQADYKGIIHIALTMNDTGSRIEIAPD